MRKGSIPKDFEGSFSVLYPKISRKNTVLSNYYSIYYEPIIK